MILKIYEILMSLATRTGCIFSNISPIELNADIYIPLRILILITIWSFSYPPSQPTKVSDTIQYLVDIFYK